MSWDMSWDHSACFPAKGRQYCVVFSPCLKCTNTRTPWSKKDKGQGRHPNLIKAQELIFSPFKEKALVAFHQGRKSSLLSWLFKSACGNNRDFRSVMGRQSLMGLTQQEEEWISGEFVSFWPLSNDSRKRWLCPKMWDNWACWAKLKQELRTIPQIEYTNIMAKVGRRWWKKLSSPPARVVIIRRNKGKGNSFENGDDSGNRLSLKLGSVWRFICLQTWKGRVCAAHGQV